MKARRRVLDAHDSTPTIRTNLPWNPATPLTPSVLVSQAELTIDEGGSGTYTVVLGHAPTADVTVAIGTRSFGLFSSNFTVLPASLTFTVDDWDTPQTVTVSAPQDPDTGDEAAYVTHTPSGGGYDDALGEEKLVVVNDDEGLSQGGFVLHGFLNPPNEITAGLDILPAL